MKHINVLKHIANFKPLTQSADLQAAVMSLKHGESSSDDVENEHPLAEQWLFVISGIGTAKVGRQRLHLSAGSLLPILRNAPHQITNTGQRKLLTLNFYSPRLIQKPEMFCGRCAPLNDVRFPPRKLRLKPQHPLRLLDPQ